MLLKTIIFLFETCNILSKINLRDRNTRIYVLFIIIQDSYEITVRLNIQTITSFSFLYIQEYIYTYIYINVLFIYIYIYTRFYFEQKICLRYVPSIFREVMYQRAVYKKAKQITCCIQQSHCLCLKKKTQYTKTRCFIQVATFIGAIMVFNENNVKYAKTYTQ